MSKYNFNPTPEQLADPKFWASDEVPDGAQRFKPECIDWFAQYLMFKDGHIQLLVDGCDQWSPVNVNHICAWHLAIKRPADPNALKRCPCGQVPNRLLIHPITIASSYSTVQGDCCRTGWQTVFCNNLTKGKDLYKLGFEAWQKSERGFA